MRRSASDKEAVHFHVDVELLLVRGDASTKAGTAAQQEWPEDEDRKCRTGFAMRRILGGLAVLGLIAVGCGGGPSDVRAPRSAVRQQPQGPSVNPTTRQFAVTFLPLPCAHQSSKSGVAACRRSPRALLTRRQVRTELRLMDQELEARARN
jgi:hypothetical protein